MTQFDFESFFDLSLDMQCIAGVDGYFKRVNPAFEQTLGWPLEQLLQTPFYDLIHPDDVAATRLEVEKLSTGLPTISFRNRYRCANGKYRHFLWSAYPDPGNGLLYATARDCTDMIEASQGLNKYNFNPSNTLVTDQATQLLNRYGFNLCLHRHIRHAVRMGNPLSLVLITPDWPVPTSLVPVEVILKNAARALRRASRISDMLARIESDRFALLLPTTCRNGCERVVAKLELALYAANADNGRISSSFGASTIDFDHTSVESEEHWMQQLISQATRALDQSLHDGKGNYTHAHHLT